MIIKKSEQKYVVNVAENYHWKDLVVKIGGVRVV